MAPTAEFSGTPTTGYTKLQVAFTDESTGSAAVSWLWNFGDGNTSTEQNPTHTYQPSGTYTVSLTVKDSSDNEDTETKTDYITASAPEAGFSGTPLTGEPPLGTAFTDESVG